MPIHSRVSDQHMPLLRRFFTWWREYGASILALLALVASAALWIAGQTGFVLVGPRDAVAQVRQVIDQRIDSVVVVAATLQKGLDSMRAEGTYTVRAVEAGNRVTCFRDRSAAEVAGIICPSGKVPR